MSTDKRKDIMIDQLDRVSNAVVLQLGCGLEADAWVGRQTVRQYSTALRSFITTSVLTICTAIQRHGTSVDATRWYS